MTYHQHVCVDAKPCTWEDAMHCTQALAWWVDGLRREAIIFQRMEFFATVKGRLPQELFDMVMRWTMMDNPNIPNIGILGGHSKQVKNGHWLDV